jgi:hypothetical protein
VSGRGSTRTGRARLVGFLALLVGILLLQTTLCDGPVADAASCVESCERVLAAAPHTDAPAPVPADHQGLIELCLTVLIAVLVGVVVARRPGGSPGAAPVAVLWSPSVAPRRAGRPCVLRL